VIRQIEIRDNETTIESDTNR